MIDFIIVDDNKQHRTELNKLIVSEMMENKLEFMVNEFDDYSKKLLTYIKNNKDNAIYILDLELPNGDGIDVARYIRDEKDDWLSPIIILTAHTSLYYNVYKQRLQVLDFVSKFSDMKTNIKENIEICIRMLNKERVYRYTYKNIEYSININSICYVQREGRQAVIVTKDKKYYQNISIHEIKNLLPDYFVQSSKGTIINMKNVEKIDWNNYLVYFKDGIKDYVVSKSHKKEIEEYDNK